MNRAGSHRLLFASLALAAPATLGGERRCGIALLLNACIADDSSDATADPTMQALSYTG